MPERCKFPLCTSWSADNGLCTSHSKYYSAEDLKGVVKRDTPKPEAKKATKKKSIPKRGKKMTSVMNEVKKLYKIFLQKHPACQVAADGCTKISTDIHHKNGRGKNHLANASTWMAVCRSCHDKIEQDDHWARQNGFKISKVKIEQ